LDKIAVFCDMDILLTAATEAEIAPSIEYITSSWKRTDEGFFGKNGDRIYICITGVGMMATAYHLAKAFSKTKFDLAIQAGICGAFDRSIAIGDVVSVISEQYGDLGAEDGDNYLDIFEMGLIDKNIFPFVEGRLPNIHSDLPGLTGIRKVSGLTVNMVAGKEMTIARLEQTYKCQVESMEGAAFHYACLQEHVPFMQLRAVSNYIERRKRGNWKIENAIYNLNEFLVKHIIKNN
jgi:futalosine hydrolase